jgi:hypothetical protein
MGFTDAPPFDGEHVELHFVDGYNETELEETISELERDGFVVTHSLCKDLCEKEIQRREAATLEREERLKDQWNTTQLEIECKIAKEVFINATNKNRKKWFWEEYEKTFEPITTCLPYRDTIFNSAGKEEYQLHKKQPCAELDCAQRGIIMQQREPGELGIPCRVSCFDPPYGAPGPCGIPCASNKIKIKRQKILFYFSISFSISTSIFKRFRLFRYSVSSS